MKVSELILQGYKVIQLCTLQSVKEFATAVKERKMIPLKAVILIDVKELPTELALQLVHSIHLAAAVAVKTEDGKYKVVVSHDPRIPEGTELI